MQNIYQSTVHAWISADSLELNLEKIQNTPNLNFH